MLTIGLTDEAYERLALLKEEGETFSDTVLRLTDHLMLPKVRANGRHGATIRTPALEAPSQ